MFSSTLKRSVATLGVVAGILAAAGPASADSAKGTMSSPNGVASSEVFELNTFGGSEPANVSVSREPVSSLGRENSIEI